LLNELELKDEKIRDLSKKLKKQEDLTTETTSRGKRNRRSESPSDDWVEIR